MMMPKLACGMKTMLRHAISQHRKVHQGLYPRRFEVPPQLEAMLYAELRPESFYLRRDARMAFEGVEVVITRYARELRLITCRNEIEYL